MKKYREKRERRKRKGIGGKRLYRHETENERNDVFVARIIALKKMEKNGPGRESLLPSTTTS